MPKRKCVFTNELQQKYLFIKKTINDSEVRCNTCSSVFSIANGGGTDIQKHIESDKHKKYTNAASSSKSIETFFSATADKKMSACEGLWAYHTVQENHSFRSADCSSNIFRSCYNMSNFHCSRTKCEAIIKNVLAPYSQEILIAEINKTRFITLLSDASNHKNVKMMPVLARYFIPTIGVCVKLLDFTAQQGETSEIIFQLLLKTSNDYNIRQKIAGFSADNTNTNFGGSARGGTNNVFYKMKTEFPNIVGVGCAAHIVHNAIKSACSSIPFDVENIVVKIYSHFYIYTVRVESLKAFCEQTDEEFKQVLGYSKSRFLTLSPAIRSILQMFNALKSYFAQVCNENVIKRFFEDPFAKLWLLFLSEQVSETLFLFYSKFPILFLFDAYFHSFPYLFCFSGKDFP